MLIFSVIFSFFSFLYSTEIRRTLNTTKNNNINHSIVSNTRMNHGKRLFSFFFPEFCDFSFTKKKQINCVLINKYRDTIHTHLLFPFTCTWLKCFNWFRRSSEATRWNTSQLAQCLLQNGNFCFVLFFILLDNNIFSSFIFFHFSFYFILIARNS